MKMTKKLTEKLNNQLDRAEKLGLDTEKYTQLFTNIQKAKEKNKRYRHTYDTPLIKEVDFITSGKNIHSNADIDRMLDFTDKYLSRNYNKEQSVHYRDQLYTNITDLFGEAGETIIQKFETLTDSELTKFFNVDNKDLATLFYDSDQDKNDFIDKTLEDINNRLEVM